MDIFGNIIGAINSFIWGDLLVYLLILAGVWFTFRLRAIQFRHFSEVFRTLIRPRQDDPGGISPFQAFCASLAARIGTGNVAGVAVAIYLGGPGAVFWMWLVAALGMATAFAESTLAQAYKVRDSRGRYRGGPAFYIARGLKAPWAAVAFSFFLILAFGLVFNAVQANSIADAMNAAFAIPHLWTAIAVTVCSALVIIGGIRGVARFSEVVVPVMAGAYLLAAIAAIAMNISAVPGVLRLIVTSAFGFGPAAGGVAGGLMAAMMNGVKRGLFSNEAGMGSAPNIAATATPNPHHPCAQGFVQAFGVFVDTILVCTATAMLILLSGVLQPGSGVTGINLTQQAMTVHFGAWGSPFVAIAILFFAFTSIAGNYAYAEEAMAYLRLDDGVSLATLRLLLLAVVLWGGMSPVTTVFEVADLAMGLMSTINIVSIMLLSGVTARLARDYIAQRRAGLEPRFDPAAHPELEGRVDLTVWAPEATPEPAARTA